MKNILLLCCLLTTSLAFSQMETNSKNLESQSKFNTGAEFSLNLTSGDKEFELKLAPHLAYQLIPKLEAGLSLGYQYSQYWVVKQNLFNFGPYLDYRPIPLIFLRAHYEYYTGKAKFKIEDTSGSVNINENTFWLGAGFRTSGKVQLYTALMYNVLYDKEESFFFSGYRPIVGISFGL